MDTEGASNLSNRLSFLQQPLGEFSLVLIHLFLGVRSARRAYERLHDRHQFVRG